jgi:ribokinase
MLKKPKLCVVGSANMDLLSKVPRLPKMGETLIGNHFYMGCGGKGSNQAVMAAKLIADVTMIAKLGRDAMGEITFKNYTDLGIDTSYVFWDTEHFSGVATIVVDDTGNNTIIIVPGANMYLTPEEVRSVKGVIESSDVLVCQLEIPIETTLEAFRIAKKAGKKTILNPAPGMPLPKELFQLSDILAPNETETELITGIPVDSLEQAKNAAAVLKEQGSHTVILTLGGRGVLLLDENGFEYTPAEKVRAIDTTGAGDAFIGSLAFFIAKGESTRFAVQKANRIAAISVTRIGTQTSFPAWDEVSNVTK